MLKKLKSFHEKFRWYYE